MKCISFLIVFFVSALCLILTVKGQKFGEIVQKCKTAEKATEDDFMNLKKNVKPKTKAMKCLSTCISENIGLISNQKINPEGTMKFVKTLPFNNEKFEQSMKQILDECKGIQDPDRCEFGSKLMDCVSDGSAKRGIQSLYPQQ